MLLEAAISGEKPVERATLDSRLPLNSGTQWLPRIDWLPRWRRGLSRNEYIKIPSFSLERSNSTDKPPPKDFDQIPVILTFIDPMAPYSSLPTHIPPYLVGVEQRDEYIRRVRPVQILRKLIYIDTQLTF